MFGFSFTVFLSVFQLLPTAPFRILDLGGTHSDAGLFLGFLTYASAVSAPLTGAIADRIGKRRVLLTCSVAIAVFSALYGVVPSYQAMLVLVIPHGVVWSGMLSASGAYVTDLVPPARRAEGLSYWGFASILAVSAAPALGLWVYEHGGWTALSVEVTILNIIMAAIAYRLPPDAPRVAVPARRAAALIEWRVLLVGVTLFLYSFSQGGITSFAALHAEQRGVTPKALYFTAFAIAVIVTRPFIARYADRAGHRRVITPCLVMVVVGVTLLALASTRTGFVVSAMIFGTGFGSAFPVFVAQLMQRVEDGRRGATFGALIAAYDMGIGTGSMTTGWIGEHYGLASAFGVGALVAALSIPYYLIMGRSRWITSDSAPLV